MLHTTNRRVNHISAPQSTTLSRLNIFSLSPGENTNESPERTFFSGTFSPQELILDESISGYFFLNSNERNKHNEVLAVDCVEIAVQTDKMADEARIIKMELPFFLPFAGTYHSSMGATHDVPKDRGKHREFYFTLSNSRQKLFSR